MNVDLRKFETDLSRLTARLAEGETRVTREKLLQSKSRLVRLRKENRVKINHSVLELLCAKSLIATDFDVEIEHPLADGLVCDVYGRKHDKSLIVEIETGFVPPTYALNPSTYCAARVVSKAARYSRQADEFALGTPPSNILQIPDIFREPRGVRSAEGLSKMKKLCDRFYGHPPITLDQIAHAKLESIYIIDIDSVRVREISPSSYIRHARALSFAEAGRD